MNDYSNSDADGGEATAVSDRTAEVEALRMQVASGIKTRGFHVADAESLSVLWGDPWITPVEKLQRVHAFATDNGWEVASKDKVTTVLFQPSGRRAILPGMWRLCRMS